MVKYFKSVSARIDAELQEKFKKKCHENKLSMHTAIKTFVENFTKEEKQVDGEAKSKRGEDSSRDSESEEIFA